MAFAPLSRLPKGVLGVLKEVGRHILRRPVVGCCAVAHAADGRIVLIRRADTGTWALPGGTLEWGEVLRDSIVRELHEEAGLVGVNVGHVVGVYSRPDRDPRFHAVTVVVDCTFAGGVGTAANPVEILDVRLFDAKALPSPLAFGMEDMVNDWLRHGAATLE